jgi:hypothetical protein
MAATELLTFQDACEHLWLTFNPAQKPPTGRENRLARLAVMSAYRSLTKSCDWNYYRRSLQLNTEAAYSTGTVAYTHTGGAYPRVLTLTNGTWPTNAARGIVVIAGVRYSIEERKSSTQLTLNANSNPGANVASTTYVWYRDAYPLPNNFRRMRVLKEVTASGSLPPLTNVSPDQLLDLTRDIYGVAAQNPELFAIANDGDYIGAFSLVFGPAPNAVVSYEGSYDASPKPLRTYLASTGTVTIAAGAVAVTGTTTAFDSFHVGSVIRFTNSQSLLPTTPWGTIDGTDNPFLAQRMIMGVTANDSLTIDAAVSSTVTLTNVKYTISDPIDIHVESMQEAFTKLCEAEYCKLSKRKDWKDYSIQALAAVQDAMYSDIRDMTMVTPSEGMYLDSRLGNVYPMGN